MRMAAGLMACVLTAATPAAQGPTREEILASVYPGAAIRPEQVFLTGDQQEQIATLARVEVTSALVARYIAVRDGAVIGRAYVDTHIVRTKRESLLIALTPANAVLRVEVTAFLEPPEFRASEIWLRQYRDQSLDSGLALNREIRPLAGATLTTRAVNAAVRRALATNAVLHPEVSRR